MYGFQPTAAHRLAQLPQQLADGGLVARMKSADAGPAAYGARGLSQLREMIPQMAAMGFKQAPAAAPAPAPAADPRAAQLQAMIPRMEAMGYKQQPQYLASGGLVRGPGTGTSDSIPDEAEPGTFIMPADSTAAIGPSALEKMGTVPVRLSDGEFKVPPEQVMALGTAVLKLFKDATHEPVNGVDGGQTDAEVDGARGFTAADAMAEMPEQLFADGGMVRFQRMDVGQWAQDQEQGRDDAARLEARQTRVREDQAAADAEAVAQVEDFKRRQQIQEAPPPQTFADGGTVDNNVTRVGNSYSGGNVGGSITVNGGAPAGTFSENPAGKIAAMPAPAATPSPVTAPAVAQPAVAAMGTPPPAAAPQAATGMGWAERNAQRNAEVSAASITNRPEWSRTPRPAPAPVAAGFQPAADRLGTMPPVGQPRLGFQPRRYADGGTVEDRAVFGFYPQLTDHGKTTRATADQLRQGVQAAGPASFQPAAPAQEPPPLPAAQRMSNLTDPRSLEFAGAPAPAPVAPAPNGALSRAAQLGVMPAGPAPAQGPVSAQNMGAADSLARRGAADAMAQMPNAPATFQAPTVRHSGNDWQARKDLENARTSAMSITNRPEWSNTGMSRFRGPQGVPTDISAYQAMLSNDLALRGAQPGMDQAAMRENSETNRATLQQRSLAAQAQVSERSAMDRTLITERGNNTRAGIAALGAAEAARIKASQEKNKEGAQQVKDTQDIFSIINEARPLMERATGSLLGTGVDKTISAFGGTTDGAAATAQLKALQGAIISKMPKMSGPQSDKDVQLYREMAGQIGDSTIPTAQRSAAMNTIEQLNMKYLPQAAGPDDLAQVPSGAWFRAPDGSVRRKP